MPKILIPGITILDRYVAREVLAPFGMGVALLTFALVTGKLLKLTDMVVNHVAKPRASSVMAMLHCRKS